MAPFYGWGSTASRLEPLRGGSLLWFTTSIQIQVLRPMSQNGFSFSYILFSQ